MRQARSTVNQTHPATNATENQAALGDVYEVLR